MVLTLAPVTTKPLVEDVIFRNWHSSRSGLPGSFHQGEESISPSLQAGWDFMVLNEENGQK